MLESVIFNILALCAVSGAGLVLFRRNPLAVTLGLFLCATACTGLYGLMSAGFPAVMQFVVFVSLITVLLVFVFMLLNVQREEFGRRRHAAAKALAIVIVAALCAKIVSILMPVSKVLPNDIDSGTMQEVGMLLFSRYLLPFGLVGFLVLASVISAAVVAGRKA